MKNKKLLITLIAVVFAFVVICLSITAFTVKQVKISFIMSTNSFDASAVTKSMQQYNGKNLLFFNVDEIKVELEKNPYINVIRIEKSFPNVIEIDVEERREIYFINYDEKTYVADKDGVVLAEKNPNKTYNSHEFITLNLLAKNQSEPFTVTDIQLGEQIQTSNNELFYKALSLCEQVHLTDSVKDLTLEKYFGGDGRDHIDVKFNTYSNVVINVLKAEENGADKAKAGFEKYDKEYSDYRKSWGYIHTYSLADGQITAVWSDREV